MEKNYSIKLKNIISKVEKNGIGEEMGIEVGDQLIKINDRSVEDIIDYLFLISDEYVEVEIIKSDGEHWVLEIDKEYHEDLSIEFENPIMDQAKHCSNKCVFCFVDQLPKNMRETLYFKDDDSRLSFLQGNFVTLTNLKREDLERIVEYKISPLNISIHATEPEVRFKMVNNKKSGQVLEHMQYLISEGIEVNGQIVLCPGYNDNEHLEKTLMDLKSLSPGMHSVAIVPVGVTKFREGLAKLEIFNEKTANETIDQVEKLQQQFLDEIGTRFAFLSDEFYMIANRELPTYDAYEGFVQLENGVGLMRLFEQELSLAIKKTKSHEAHKPVTILTGASAYDFMVKMSKRVCEKFNILIDVKMIKNDFFGHTITVAGLITAQDIISQLRDDQHEHDLLIPDVMLRTGETIFLDDITLDELSKTLKRHIRVTKVNGQDFLDTIIGRAPCQNQ